jgi:hypothetical protein
MVQHQLGAVTPFCDCCPRHEWASRLPQGPGRDRKALKNVNRASTAANPMPRHRGGEKIEFFAFFWGFL